MVPSGYYDSTTAILGIDNFHIHQARAQAKVVQVISDDSGEVLVVCAVSVSVQIGRILTASFVQQRVLLQLIRNPATYRHSLSVKHTCWNVLEVALRRQSRDIATKAYLWVPLDSSTTLVRLVLLDSSCKHSDV